MGRNAVWMAAVRRTFASRRALLLPSFARDCARVATLNPMERTPFDEPVDESPEEEFDDDFDPTEFDAPEEPLDGEDEDAEFDEDESQSPTRAVPRWFWPVFGAIVLVLAMMGGGIWAGKRAENARLADLRDRIGAIVRNDNALVLEILGADGSQNITYAEFFNRTAKNKSDRDTLIRKLRTMVAPDYQGDIDNLVQLMEIENEYVRAEEAVTRQKLEVASRHDALEEIAQANDAGLNSPYVPPSGDEFVGQSVEVTREAGAAFRKYKMAREEMARKLTAATTAIDNWIAAEPRLYPQWAPPRDVLDALQSKKRRYNIATPDPNAQPDAPINPGPDAPPGQEFTAPPLPEAQPTPTPEPTATPEPTIEPTDESQSAPDDSDSNATPAPTTESAASDTNAPIRDDAPERLPGERFAQTRTRELSPDGLTKLSDDDLRYMTNEMFARYGQTFGDKDYQAQFADKSWYHPNPKWSSGRIRRAFTDLEKNNLKALINERNRRKKEGRGY